MQGAMRGISISRFQASCGCSGISKLFWISIAQAHSGAEFAAFAALRHGQEKLVEGNDPIYQALLVGVTDERAEIVRVLLAQAVFPRIRAEQLLLLFPRFLVPRERHEARISHLLHRDGLG